MSEAKNARRRERYATDVEFREREKAKSRAWKEANRDYIHERERKGRERMREALGRPERYCMPWTTGEMAELRGMVGMSRREIAERLRRSEAGVKRRAESMGMCWDGTRRLAERPTDGDVTDGLRRLAEGRAFYA